MSAHIENILKEYKLSLTSIRKEVLKHFLKKKSALSQADLENSVGKEYDRVTVYRTLKMFHTKGIIHKVPDDSGNAKYALCIDNCHDDHHEHEHVHFKCVKCGDTNCLNNIKIPRIKLPSGYKYRESHILVQGICKDCA